MAVVIAGTITRTVVRRLRLHRAVDPDLRLASLHLTPPFWRVLLPYLRRSLTAPSPVVDGVVRTRHHALAAPDGHVPTVHVHRPRDAAPGAAVVWMHGGGYVSGTAGRDNLTCSALAADTGVTVVAVEYRLAPEHPHPAALEDCLAAVRWVLSDEVLDVDSARLVVAGASAGGGLAAATTHRLVDEGVVPALQLLVYPMLDDRTVRRRVSRHPRLVWGRHSNRAAWRAYLGRRPGRADVPASAAPARRTDLSGLPATWIGVGTLDLFHDEDVEHARRLRAAGVDVELVVVPGMYHGADAAFADRAAATRDFRGSLRTAIRRAVT